MTIKLQIIFYSMYGYIYRMTEAVAQGAREVKDVEVNLFRVPELIPDEILEKSGAKEAQKTFSHIPIINYHQTTDADAYIFGTPTRFGNMCAQMRHFVDQLGGSALKNIFAGKIGSVLTRTNAEHGGQESTVTNFHSTLLNLGMILTSPPHSKTPSMETPYGVATLAGTNGNRIPTENELAIAHAQGKQVAEIARALNLGRRM